MSEDIKVTALARYLDVSEDEISECLHGDNMYECDSDPGEYLVLTDDEADRAWDKELERYIDECIFPECPEPVRSYFDREAWKRDAKHDGRGHALASYDSEEHEEKIGEEWIFIYRVN